MTHSPEIRSRKRAPRVSLRENIPATVQLENGRHLPANLRQLSRTGGLLELTACLDERAKVGLTFPFDSGTVYARAEMLFPMRGTRGYLQPFRFTGLGEEPSQILEREIAKLLRQTMAPANTGRGLGSRPRFLMEPF